MTKDDANKFAKDLEKVFQKHNIKMWRASKPATAIVCPDGQEPVRVPTSTGKWIWVCQDA
jgi:hypothetical protein